MAELPHLPDRYRPIRLVGEGATGSVYEAEDRLLGLRAAVKIVRSNLAIHARFRARFAHEVALSARVVHPRLVPVFDQGRLADGRPFVALAYADGGSLDDLLDQGPPLSEVLRLIDQVLDALAWLHAEGLLHQDLKPGNVLLHRTAGGRMDAWVADLGVTEALSVLAMDRRGISGTPGWMAPEQLSGRAQELGPWTDLYAVGLMLYAMLGGNLRADGKDGNTADLLRQRMRLEVKLDSSLPRALEEVIANLLDAEPRQRYDRAADVRRALTHAVSALPSDVGAQGVSRPRVRRSSTTFADTFLPEGRVPLAAGGVGLAINASYRWNCVQPDPMPHPVPMDGGWDAPARASVSLIALREPPLVGRHEIRQRLWSLAREVVRTGAPQVALVVGAAGTGKSRLVSSVVNPLDQLGYMEPITLRYHLPAGPDDGYRGAVREILAPWTETRAQIEERLTRWLSRDWQVPRTSVADEAALLARWCGSLREGETPIHAAAGLAFLYRYLDVRAWRGGATMVLEDAHLAQAAGDGLAICEALLRRTVGERPVLALATLSAEAIDANPALAAQVAGLVALGAVRIDVPPLTDEEIRRLLIEGYLVDPALASAAAPRCQGSPSFATLLLRDWAARRLLVQLPSGSFGLHPHVRFSAVTPKGLDDLCLSRVQGALAAAEDAAAATEALAAITLAGQDPPTLVVRSVSPGGLDALLATGLVRQRGWHLAFEYGEVQRAASRLAEQLHDPADLHRRLADSWATLGRKTGADVDLPHGLHRLHADQPAEAVAPLLRAAHTALVEGRAALALDAARLAALAADRLENLSDRVEARSQQAEALLELERIEEVVAVVAQARKLGRLGERGSARLQVILARAALRHGALDQAERLLGLAQTAFQGARDRQGLLSVAMGWAALYRLTGYPEEAVSCYRQVLAQSPEEPRIEVEALKEVIECSVTADAAEGLEQDVARLRRAAWRSGDTRDQSHATYAAGLVHVYRGQLDHAERHFRTAQALAATLGADELIFRCQRHLGEVFRARQEDDVAASFFDAAARFAEDRGWLDGAATARVSLALVAIRRGAEHRAHVEVDRACQLLAEQPHHWAWTVVGVLRAMAGAQVKDADAVRAWWQVARERGIARIRPGPELQLALQRLAAAAAPLGLAEIAAEALALAPLPAETPQQDDTGLEEEIIDLPRHAIGAARQSPSLPGGETRMPEPKGPRPVRPPTHAFPSAEEIPTEELPTDEVFRTDPDSVTLLPDDLDGHDDSADLEDTPAPQPARAAPTFVPEDALPPCREVSAPPPSHPVSRAPPSLPPTAPPRTAPTTFMPEDDPEPVPTRRKR